MSGHYTLDLGLIIPWTSGFALKSKVQGITSADYPSTPFCMWKEGRGLKGNGCEHKKVAWHFHGNFAKCGYSFGDNLLSNFVNQQIGNFFLKKFSNVNITNFVI
jgi:hypothetical protein